MRDEYDFSNAKRATDIPHLARLQAEAQNKKLVAVLLDSDIFVALEQQAKSEGLEYQIIINRLLRQAIALPKSESPRRSG